MTARITGGGGRSLLTRLLLFTAPPLLASFAPIFVLSSVARTSGSPGWVSLLLGQSIGSIGCLIATWGWDIGGPARAASADDEHRRALLALSLANRAPIAAVMVVVTTVAAALLAPPAEKPLAVAAALAGTVQGLSLNWWFTATGRPMGVVLTDALPRTLAALVAAAGIIAGLPALIYPILAIGATGTAYWAGYQRHLTGARRPSAAEVRRSIMQDGRLALIAVTTTAYTTATLPIVQGISPIAAPAFGAAQRVTGYWTFSTVVLGNTAQNWVNKLGRSAVPARARTALLVFAAEGTVLGAALWLLGPPVARIVFGSGVDLPDGVFAAFGIMFFAVAVSTALGRLLLIPLGREAEVAAITMVTAVVGVTALCICTATGGPVGASAALAGTEVFATVLLGIAAMRASSRKRLHATAGAMPVAAP